MSQQSEHWAKALDDVAGKLDGSINPGIIRSAAAYIRRQAEAAASIGAGIDKALDRAFAPQVTTHAVAKLRSMVPKYDKSPHDKCVSVIRTMLANATPVRLRRQFRVRQLLTHNMESADYYRTPDGKIIVVCGEVVVTVHNGKANRLEEINRT